jgi:hypothetical protein
MELPDEFAEIIYDILNEYPEEPDFVHRCLSILIKSNTYRVEIIERILTYRINGINYGSYIIGPYLDSHFDLIFNRPIDSLLNRRGLFTRSDIANVLLNNKVSSGHLTRLMDLFLII